VHTFEEKLICFWGGHESKSHQIKIRISDKKQYAYDHMSEWADTLWQGYFDFDKIWQAHYL